MLIDWGNAKTGPSPWTDAQQVYEWGFESVRLIMEKLVENKTPSSPIVNAKLIPIRKADADAYGKNWEKWLGKK